MTDTTSTDATAGTTDTTSTVPPALVVACAAYTVTQVAGLRPTALEEFAGQTDFVVDGLTGEHHVWGQGGEVSDGVVRFFEKGDNGTGKDVRVWTVSRSDKGFLATC